ncbi:unnamed protein product [Rotaria socialis]|uniref:Tyrosine-protein kinase ephrin type A/B receptor-like domain-containing protein n=1 Tax=Rotaria socialis TaxID=392032 RepID=A0A820DRK4_9BILA|nr:unnamed protein product [Rotaria socialis]CAF3370791.1 unnamed protein product [Rotaria socialis]CAF3376807.1 unnamed protein product [Rotaria socialis]CAF4236278.1 unnamed protein product [Rotaria socialis]CAF4510701.1 unnamed protein product [Rotaria socialis]
MDAAKAGVEKGKETTQGKKAHDATEKSSKHADAPLESDKAKIKEGEHASNSEHRKDKHTSKADENPKPCSPGTFNDLNSQTSCAPCADGNYSAYPGAVACDLCPIGSYGDEKMKHQNYVQLDLSVWKDKQWAHHVQLVIRQQCDRCPSGSFADVAGLAYCITCPAGFVCTNTRSAPVACPSNVARGQTVCSSK